MFSLKLILRIVLECECVIDSFSLIIVYFFSGTDWEDPDDPTVIAENELLGAANSIEAAARKLQSLRPRVSHAKVIY